MSTKATPVYRPKSRSNRLQVVNDAKMKCIEHRLDGEMGTRVLFRILDKYHQDGTPFINKTVKLNLRGDIDRFYLINLYNQEHKRDVVLIRAVPREIMNAIKAGSHTEDVDLSGNDQTPETD